MNVWALNKDNAIRRLLLALADRFDPAALALSERWANDPRAVGICQPGAESLLAYIFTYGQEDGRYGLHLEYPGASDLGASTQMVEGIALEQVIGLLAAHFDLG